ncbi:MAG: hypothetical protein KF852_03215 [Saprospiraceae bacterium]|nr:hypothetical protein [Saprospiraceae bacterium]
MINRRIRAGLYLILQLSYVALVGQTENQDSIAGFYLTLVRTSDGKIEQGLIEIQRNQMRHDTLMSDSLGRFLFPGHFDEDFWIRKLDNEQFLEIVKTKSGKSNKIILIQDGVDKFRRLCHAVSNLIITLILFFIWQFYFKKIFDKKKESPDFGLLLISAALLMWGGLSVLVFFEITVFNSVFSSINNLFFLWSLPFFDHGFHWMHNKKNKTIWMVSTGFVTIGLLVLLPILDNTNKLASDGINFGFSSLTLSMLGVSLYRTFNKRDFFPISIISAIVIIAALVGQSTMFFYKVDSYLGIYDEAFFLVSYIIISALFVVLGFSWLNEELSSIIPINLSTYDDKSKKIDIEGVKKELSEGKDSKAIQEILAFLNTRTSDTDLLKDELILLSSSLYALNTQYRIGTINLEENMKGRSKITAGILDFIDTHKIGEIK